MGKGYIGKKKNNLLLENLTARSTLSTAARFFRALANAIEYLTKKLYPLCQRKFLKLITSREPN